MILDTFLHNMLCINSLYKAVLMIFLAKLTKNVNWKSFLKAIK